ncbi:MAG TPA: hypothetical protein VHE30_08195 [Polyangiaceae bacterium]|nr:hypothetical protein [Polyangiaceae bacterium]
MREGPPKDRRRSRSADPLLSLCRLFEAARQRDGLDAVVLADPTGLAIAGAGSAATCDELAALCPFLLGSGDRPANDVVPCRLDVLDRTLAVQRLRIDGIEVFLCAEGLPELGDAGMAGVLEGCQRILSRKRHGAGA